MPVTDAELQRSSGQHLPQPVLNGLYPVPRPAGTPELWVLTKEEKARYEAMFPQYDKNGDGVVAAGEAVALFTKSGLDRLTLKKVPPSLPIPRSVLSARCAALPVRSRVAAASYLTGLPIP